MEDIGQNVAAQSELPEPSKSTSYWQEAKKRVLFCPYQGCGAKVHPYSLNQHILKAHGVLDAKRRHDFVLFANGRLSRRELNIRQPSQPVYPVKSAKPKSAKPKSAKPKSAKLACPIADCGRLLGRTSFYDHFSRFHKIRSRNRRKKLWVLAKAGQTWTPPVPTKRKVWVAGAEPVESAPALIPAVQRLEGATYDDVLLKAKDITVAILRRALVIERDKSFKLEQLLEEFLPVGS